MKKKEKKGALRHCLGEKPYIDNYSCGIQLWDIHILCEMHVFLHQTLSTSVNVEGGQPSERSETWRQNPIKNSKTSSYQRMPGNVMYAGGNTVVLECSLGLLFFIFWCPNWIDWWELESAEFIKLPQNIK